MSGYLRKVRPQFIDDIDIISRHSPSLTEIHIQINLPIAKSYNSSNIQCKQPTHS